MDADQTTRQSGGTGTGTGIAMGDTPHAGIRATGRILVVDDERSGRDDVAALLALQNYALTSAGSGQEAIASIAEQPPDLIIVDVMMPGMDGYELVRKLKADPGTAAIPIIMVSALQDRRSLLLALHAGAADFLRKPVDASELRARVKNLVRLKAKGDDRERYGQFLEAEVGSRTAELVASERLYRETFDDAPVGIVHVGMNGRWLRVNQRLCDLLGYTRAELLDPAIQAVVLSDVTAGMETTVTRVQNTSGQHIVSEDRYRHHDGRVIWLRLNMTVHCQPDGAADHLILVLEDITQERALEVQLRQASKMDALGGLAAGLAHDFNNLLSVIVSCSEMAMSEVEPGSATFTDLEAIHGAGQRAAKLTRQLLAFSRHQVLCPQIVELGETVSGMHDMLRRLIREDIELIEKHGDGVSTILIDPDQLEQIIMNLAINAGDAMVNGGTLTIESTTVHLDATHHSHHPGVMAGPHIMLTVRDTGVGMDAETQAHMFEPFFTTKALGKGTGLGLSTVFGIVRQSGGRVWAESELGTGTTFYVCFPRTTEAPASVAEPLARRSEQGTETILLVEDDEPVRAVTHNLLTRAGYHVLPARNAEDAAELCETHTDPIHLLLTDIVMPGINGWELAAKLRARRPEMKVLYMSGYADGAHFTGEHGATPFLEKPITTEMLARKVHEALLHT